MTDANPFKAGSRKAAIYDVFKAKGIEAAYKEAEKLEIKAGTVKSWSGSWTKGTLPAKKAKGEKSDKPAKASRKPGEFDPEAVHFRHTTRAAAQAHIDQVCKRNGLRSHAYHVLENEGKFAVVPVTYRPIGPVPQFKKGDIVYDTYISNSRAKVIEPGPEQTLIKYDKESTLPGRVRPRESCELNRFLIKLPDEPVAAKPKRERLDLTTKSGVNTEQKKPVKRLKK